MISFFSKKETAFGLDLSSSSLKIFQFGRLGNSLTVKAFSEEPLPKGVMNGDDIADKQVLQDIVRKALQQPLYGHISGKQVVASLPETKSFIRIIQIPRMSDQEAEGAVPFEAESFIPLPIDQVYLDWQKVGETADKMNILIIAAPRDFVDSYVEVLEGAGLTPAALEVESQSCHRAVLNPADKQTVLIVDMAGNRTSLIMVEEGNLQFTSTIPIAGDTFTESIARTLGVSSAKAEIIKQKVGIANTVEYPNIKTSLLPILNNLSAEIKNILKFHSEHSDKPVSQILLTGGSSRLTNLAEFLTPEFSSFPGLSVKTANAWEHLKNVTDVPLSSEQALTYTTAIGLGLRGGGYTGYENH